MLPPGLGDGDMKESKNRECAAAGMIAEREDLAFHREIMLRLKRRLRPPIANNNHLFPKKNDLFQEQETRGEN